MQYKDIVHMGVLPCDGILCIKNSCPFNMQPLAGGCDGYGMEREYKLFKEELKRREENMNTMPELKAGMLVSNNGNDFFILLLNTDKNKGLQAYCRDGREPLFFSNNDIITIKEIRSGYHYGVFFNNRIRDDNTNLIWSKKSDTDIKIDELTETIKKASQQIEELRKGIK